MNRFDMDVNEGIFELFRFFFISDFSVIVDVEFMFDSFIFFIFL
jgi:hypothetical protein